jgi:CheY-like chemotaxis protein
MTTFDVPPPPPPPPPRAQVIVIEDDADTLAMVGRVLTLMQIDAMPVATCEAARHAATDTLGRPDLVIAYSALPDGDGVACATAMRARHGCRTLIFSGHLGDDDREPLAPGRGAGRGARRRRDRVDPDQRQDLPDQDEGVRAVVDDQDAGRCGLLFGFVVGHGRERTRVVAGTDGMRRLSPAPIGNPDRDRRAGPAG